MFPLCAEYPLVFTVKRFRLRKRRLSSPVLPPCVTGLARPSRPGRNSPFRYAGLPEEGSPSTHRRRRPLCPLLPAPLDDRMFFTREDGLAPDHLLGETLQVTPLQRLPPTYPLYLRRIYFPFCRCPALYLVPQLWLVPLSSHVSFRPLPILPPPLIAFARSAPSARSPGF